MLPHAFIGPISLTDSLHFEGEHGADPFSLIPKRSKMPWFS